MGKKTLKFLCQKIRRNATEAVAALAAKYLRKKKKFEKGKTYTDENSILKQI